MDCARENHHGSRLPHRLIPIHHHHHHHHHLFHVSPHCPFHRSVLQPTNHSPSCSFSTPQNPQPHTNALVPLDELTKLEHEDDEDPVLVLTDEWKEFFAKSEAKRKLVKKQVKKKGKN